MAPSQTSELWYLLRERADPWERAWETTRVTVDVSQPSVSEGNLSGNGLVSHTCDAMTPRAPAGTWEHPDSYIPKGVTKQERQHSL